MIRPCFEDMKGRYLPFPIALAIGFIQQLVPPVHARAGMCFERLVIRNL